MNLNHNRQEEILIMTTSKKSLIVGAALAGLIAGSAGVQASTVLHGVRASLTSQDPGSTSEKAKALASPETRAAKQRTLARARAAAAQTERKFQKSPATKSVWNSFSPGAGAACRPLILFVSIGDISAFKSF